jgi:hypothetical protein
VIAQCNEQVEEQLAAAIVHLKLHRATPLEGAATANDQGKVVRTKLRICFWRVGVGVASRS